MTTGSIAPRPRTGLIGVAMRSKVKSESTQDARSSLELAEFLTSPAGEAELRSAGSEQFEAGEVSVKQRETLDLFLAERGSDVGAVSFHQRYIFRRYCHLLSRSPNLKLYIEPSCLVSVHRNGGRFDNREPRSFDTNVILVGDKVGNTVVAGPVGSSLKSNLFWNRCYCQLRPNNRSAGLICDRSEDTSVDGLSARGCRDKGADTQDDQDQNQWTCISGV